MVDTPDIAFCIVSTVGLFGNGGGELGRASDISFWDLICWLDTRVSCMLTDSLFTYTPVTSWESKRAGDRRGGTNKGTGWRDKARAADTAHACRGRTTTLLKEGGLRRC